MRPRNTLFACPVGTHQYEVLHESADVAFDVQQLGRSNVVVTAESAIYEGSTHNTHLCASARSLHAATALATRDRPKPPADVRWIAAADE